MPVYARPFPMKEESRNTGSSFEVSDHHGGGAVRQDHNRTEPETRNYYASSTRSNIAVESTPIRRVRHSEVVLVDEVSLYYGKYWLRLRWPGSRGGVAGYIVLGDSKSIPNDVLNEWKGRLKGAVGGIETLDHNKSTSAEGTGHSRSSENSVAGHSGSHHEGEEECHDMDDHQDEDQNDSDNESFAGSPANLRTLPGAKTPSHFIPRCESTGLYYPSTTTMELLAMYDDGIEATPSVASITGEDGAEDDDESGEPVFCRICREGLHDVDYDFEIKAEGFSEHLPSPTGGATPRNSGSGNEMFSSSENTTHDQTPILSSLSQPAIAQPINHPYAANPLMAPCECSGSMAFVHSLCIEQWRCRSHHPAARNGLNCETCKASYTLPPPMSRPVVNEEEDWMEAMPPHVLAALRRPHICWSIGAALIRRRWLRPIAPVLMSPIVALYCRARRTLKKMGVSRRRWACSLCRRRARWKCVRCLRSYYCSRQCQNVSWHIVHKHVCYKPSRFWWSVVVYGLAFVYFFPGVLSYPLMYDLGLSFLWLSFVVSGVIGGGIATILKKQMAIDIRGRGLEALVVLMTCWLTVVCWGLVWAFFGETGECKGSLNYVFHSNHSTTVASVEGEDEQQQALTLMLIRTFVLQPAKKSLVHIDSLLVKLGPLLTKWICYSGDNFVGKDNDRQYCLQLTQKANPDFLMSVENEKCISDVYTVGALWGTAIFLQLTNYSMRRIERFRRAAVIGGRHPRPHQD